MAYKYDFSLTQTTSNYDLSIFEHDKDITLCSFINKEYPFMYYKMIYYKGLNILYIL